MTADELAKDVGERLLSLRTKLGLTQTEVAAKANLSVSYIGMLERGDRLPHIDVLFSVASALDVPLTYFFEEPNEAADLAYLRTMAPIVLVVKRLRLSPANIQKAARVVWAGFAPFDKMEKPPV